MSRQGRIPSRGVLSPPRGIHSTLLPLASAGGSLGREQGAAGSDEDSDSCVQSLGNVSSASSNRRNAFFAEPNRALNSAVGPPALSNFCLPHFRTSAMIRMQAQAEHTHDARLNSTAAAPPRSVESIRLICVAGGRAGVGIESGPQLKHPRSSSSFFLRLRRFLRRNGVVAEAVKRSRLCGEFFLGGRGRAPRRAGRRVRCRIDRATCWVAQCGR